jgi:hypothetical protein
MLKVISKELWKEIRARARRAQRRKAAIAYVTQNFIGLRKADVLVVDASEYAIANGETDAPLLRNLLKKGVRLYSCADLHAKVILMDNTAVVGSANMSRASAITKVEAGLISDQPSIVAAVASLIEQLVQQSRELGAKDVNRLCKIKVNRRGGRQLGRPTKRKAKIDKLGNNTWLIGLRGLVREPSPQEQRLIDRAINKIRQETEAEDDDIGWMKLGTRGQFVRECRAGDNVIQIWRTSHHAKRPSVVMRSTPILLKQRTKDWTRFYLEDPTGRYAELNWGDFKRLLKRLGYPRRIGPGTIQLLEQDMADAIHRNWNSAGA